MTDRNLTVIDFETYYDDKFSLGQLSIPEFVYDPRFKIHGLALRWPGGATEFRTDVDAMVKEIVERFGSELEGTTILCHHAHFDLYVLNHRFGVRPRYFADTMLLARHVHGPKATSGDGASLHALATRHGLAAKGDLSMMSGVREPDARQLADLSDYARHDVGLTYELVDHLVPRVSRPEIEFPLMMHTVRLFTERVVHVNHNELKALNRDVADLPSPNLSQRSIDMSIIAGNKAFPEAIAKQLACSGRSLPTKPGKHGPIPALAKSDRAMLQMVHDADPEVAVLATARLAKKSGDQFRGGLATLGRIVAATGGVIPPYLNYYGAHTGRFSGGGKFNLQNLGRSGVCGQICGLLVPRHGYRWIIADFAQIEARVTAWLAGEDAMLAAFAEGRDLYSEFAAHIFNEPVRKSTDQDEPDTKDHLDALRHVGKAAVLGLGFGMGADKFLTTLMNSPATCHLVACGQLTPVLAKQVVDTYRDTYPKIKRYWRGIERSVRNAIGGGNYSFGAIPIDHDGDVMRLRLKSGRKLRYPDVRLDHTPRDITYTDQSGQKVTKPNPEPGIVYGRGKNGNGEYLYGGKLCENIVQATARDLLVEAILELERRGLPVAFHVHDEVIVEMPEASADESARRVEEVMSDPPGWAEGLPVAAEVKVADRYGK